MAKRESFNWEYYKGYLQQYCMTNLSYSNRIPENSKYYQRKFYSPSGESGKGTGGFYLNDPTDHQNGNHYTRWYDITTQQSGNIYDLMVRLGDARNKVEAYNRCVELYGKAPKREQGASRSPERQAERRAYKYRHMERSQAELVEERQRCQAQRVWIEKQVLQNLMETGSFFKDADKIPVYLQHNSKDKTLHTKQMTCANYLHAMILHEDDPRYIGKKSIEKQGLRLRPGAMPVLFEYLEHKDEAEHVVTWSLYNAKDVIGLPPYEPPQKASEEEITESIKMMLKSVGVEPDKTLFESKEEFFKNLREAASTKTWKDAEVLGQRALEQELVMTRMLQFSGMKEPYKVANAGAIIEHLTRDVEKKESRNLFLSGYRMDVAVRTMTDSFENYAKMEIERLNQEVKKMMEKPLNGLSVTVEKDLSLPGQQMVPGGITLKDEEAYKLLAAVVRQDKAMFDNVHHPAYNRPVDLQVSWQGQEIPVHTRLGQLDTGNVQNVYEALRVLAVKEARDKVFDEPQRLEAIAAEVKRRAYTSEEFRDAYEKNPQVVEDSIKRELYEQYEVKEAEIAKAFGDMGIRETQYQERHPELQLKSVADTYLYLVPAKAVSGQDILSEDEALAQHIFKTSAPSRPLPKAAVNELLEQYGSDVVLSVRTPQEYGNPKKGYVIESRVPFEPGLEGQYLLPGKPDTAAIMAKPFPKEIEETRMQNFEKSFTVTVKQDGETERYQGDEARTYLAMTMDDDRHMYEEQQSGYKDVEQSKPQHLTIAYGNTVLADKQIYLGRMDLGNYQSVQEAVIGLAEDTTTRNGGSSRQQQVLRDVIRDMRPVTKYSPEQGYNAIIRSFEKIPKAEIEKSLQQDFSPKGMDRFRPNRVPQTLANRMKWFEAKAEVNFCHEPEQKAAYLVKELAGRYKEDTVRDYMDRFFPALKDRVTEHLKKPEVQRQFTALKEKQEQRTQKARVR